MGFLSFIFGNNKKQVEDYLKNGAVIIDVRTKKEWNNGHIESSIHIPLDKLKDRVEYIKTLDKPVITCCKSGARSAKAAQYLNLNNVASVNGGSWMKLNKSLA